MQGLGLFGDTHIQPGLVAARGWAGHDSLGARLMISALPGCNSDRSNL
jgi:hypothetical protein